MNIVNKTCSVCEKNFPATSDYFYWKHKAKRRFQSHCKLCNTKLAAIRYRNNPEKYRDLKRNWRKANPEKDNNYQKEYYRANTEKYSTNARLWKSANPEKVRGYSEKYEKANMDKRRIDDKERQKKKRATPKGNLNNRMTSSIRVSLKGSKNGRGWESLVGYTCKDLKKHLEKQFCGGMSWENMGEWHIDHIIPISVFNFTKTEHEDFKRCWALENLQPLWAKDNMRKHAKLDKPFQPSLAF